MPSILPTQSNPYLSPVIETLLPFSSKDEDKVFNPGIFASHLLSHRGFNPSKIISDFSESPMMIHGGDIPISGDCPDYEDSRARGFVHRPLNLQSFECLWESDILDLVD
ncbi:hypothetical protein Tco_0844084 [Tanacetum coccineum]